MSAWGSYASGWLIFVGLCFSALPQNKIVKECAHPETLPYVNTLSWMPYSILFFLYYVTFIYLFNMTHILLRFLSLMSSRSLTWIQVTTNNPRNGPWPSILQSSRSLLQFVYWDHMFDASFDFVFDMSFSFSGYRTLEKNFKFILMWYSLNYDL